MKIIAGDLLKANSIEYPYIIQQVNCTSIRAAGLAKAIFHAFPWADVYSDRSPRGNDVQKFGQVMYSDNKVSNRRVANPWILR